MPLCDTSDTRIFFSNNRHTLQDSTIRMNKTSKQKSCKETPEVGDVGSSEWGPKFCLCWPTTILLDHKGYYPPDTEVNSYGTRSSGGCVLDRPGFRRYPVVVVVHWLWAHCCGENVLAWRGIHGMLGRYDGGAGGGKTGLIFRTGHRWNMPWHNPPHYGTMRTTKTYSGVVPGR